MLVLLFLFGNVFLMTLKKDTQVVRLQCSHRNTCTARHCGAPDAASAKCLFRRAGHRSGFLKNDKIFQKLFIHSSSNLCCIKNLVHLQHLELNHSTEKSNVFFSWNWSRRAIRFETWWSCGVVSDPRRTTCESSFSTFIAVHCTCTISYILRQLINELVTSCCCYHHAGKRIWQWTEETAHRLLYFHYVWCKNQQLWRL